MGSLNTGVDDVGTDTSTGGTVVGVGGGTSAGVGETGKTPGSTLLDVEGVDLSVLLDVGNLFARSVVCFIPARPGITHVGVAAENLNLLLGEGGREAAELLVDGVSLGDKGADSGGLETLASLQLDDVGTLDELGGLIDQERGALRGSGSDQGQSGEEGGGTHLEGWRRG